MAHATEYIIDASRAGQRIDVASSELSGMTRSRIQHLIEKGFLTVNEKQVKQNYRAKEGDRIGIAVPEEEVTLLPEDLPVEILFADPFVVVVNKPAGMVVYPAAGHAGGTLMNALACHIGKLASVGGPLRPGVVHRLDRDTSGIMVVAVDDEAYYSLVEQFRKRTITRKYTALVYGDLKDERGEIDLKIGRSESDRKKMSTRVRRGKEALTRWNVIERFGAATMVEVRLGTGRTHQIRVHFASAGHPVLGDKTYGRKTFVEKKGKRVFFERQMLHAQLLGFAHPATGEHMEFSKPEPADMEEAVKQLREP